MISLKYPTRVREHYYKTLKTKLFQSRARIRLTLKVTLVKERVEMLKVI